MMGFWELAAIGAKLVLYFGVLVSAGTVFAAALFHTPVLRGFACVWGLFGVLASVVGFALGGAALTGDASGLTDPEILGLLWTTPAGTALLWRVGGLVLLCIGVFLGRAGLGCAVLGGGFALWSFVSVGHVQAHGALWLNILLWVHVAVAALWIGILRPLTLAVRTSAPAQAADLGHRFGQVAMVLVPALVVAGLWMAWILVGSPQAIWDSAYGQTLVMKVLAVAGLLGLASMNKLRFIPKMRQSDPNASAGLARSIRLEWLAFCVILAATAYLTTGLTPPAG